MGFAIALAHSVSC